MRSWFYAFVSAAAVALAALTANLVWSELRPENVWGLVYGSVAAALLVAASALGVRRRTMKASSRLGAGRTRAWLDFHIYGSLLFLLLLLMHSGFSVPTIPKKNTGPRFAKLRGRAVCWTISDILMNPADPQILLS